LPAVWLRVDHRQPGQRSAEEAAAVADVVDDLVRQHGLPPEEVAVIAPFRAQGRLIRSALQQQLVPGQERVLVDTVERIQGQEREAVVISLAAGDPDDLSGRAGFLFSEHRLNVALSRARTKVVLVASAEVFRALPGEPAALRVASRLKELRGRLAERDLTAVYAAR
jgi:DNA replication ATP-dependent helicase Dna2